MNGFGQRAVGRAATNPFSNLIFTAPDIGALIGRRLGLGVVPTFIHEMTHHWCFDTPVGWTIALLQMRAARRAVAVARETDASAFALGAAAVFADVARVNVLLEVLRPLAEGLALFAEHDLVPGDAPLISRPALFTAAFFGGVVGGPEFLERAPAILGASRHTVANVRRKADLLVQPLASKDVYLAGYLAMKSLHLSLFQKDRRYFDSDFFAHAVKAYLYDDWDLVYLVLGVDEAPEELGKTIAVYCGERLRDLPQLEHERLLDGFVRRGEGSGGTDLFEHHTEGVSFKGFANCLTLAHRATDAKRLLAEVFDDAFAPASHDEDAMLRILHQIEWSLRGNALIAEARVEGRVDADELRLFMSDQEEPILAVPRPPSLASDWKGHVDCDLLFHQNIGRVLMLCDEKELLAQELFGAEANAFTADIRRAYSITRQLREELATVAQQTIDRVLRAAGHSERLARLRSEVGQPLASLLVRVGVPCQDAMLDEVAAQMAADGFLPMVDDDVDLLVDAAAISLCAPFRRSPSTLLPKWQWSRGSLEASRAAIRAHFAERTGLDPFAFVDERVIHSRI